ncbi:unnamed protein product [Polarella glacialis]|uniref:PUM-HD domain-containing protein n=1 Tax=Polarella glacialis TaxID=89957 RepID=A0A813H9T1_POLGL|nr:unnamed protein product [Polarella glacialis]
MSRAASAASATAQCLDAALDVSGRFGFGGPLPALAVCFRVKAMHGATTPGWARFLPCQLQAAVVQGVWSLSQKARGCRRVQEAIVACTTDQQRESIAKELLGHIWDAARCPHANFVLQRLIEAMRPTASQFIIDEILQHGSRAAAQVARHKYGCRIIQRLLEHCRPDQVEQLAEELLKDSMGLFRHPYGNYVLQELLVSGTPSQKSRISRMLEQHTLAVVTDCHASAVTAKALTYGSQKDKCRLAHALAAQSSLVPAMAYTRHGYVVAQLVLQLLEGQDRERVLQEMSQYALSLRTSRYGRLALASMSEPCVDIVTLLQGHRSSVQTSLTQDAAEVRRCAAEDEASLIQLYGLCAQAMRDTKAILEEAEQQSKLLSSEWSKERQRLRQRGSELAARQAAGWQALHQAVQQDIARLA